MAMRMLGLAACGLIAACTTAPITVPNQAVLYEVPRAAPPPAPGAAGGRPQASAPAAAAPAAGGARSMTPEVARQDDFTARIERVLSDPPAGTAPDGPTPGAGEPPAALPPATLATPSEGAPAPGAAGATPLDDDLLNLNLYTLEQQRIDAAIAERELEEARRQLVIVEPGASVPQPIEGVNIALYAKQTTHAVGERRYARPFTARATSAANCRRFSSPDQAQRVFLASGGPERDPYNLDPDGDGFACDWDPEPFRRLGR